MSTETQKMDLSNVSDARILQAIAECDRYIDREGARAADLRPASAQQHLNYCIGHKTKLLAVLEARA